MAWVIFFRGVNVGRHNRFQPRALAKSLAAFDATNIGAAGTLVVRDSIAAAALREEVLRRLDFEPQLMIRPGDDVAALREADAFAGATAAKDLRKFVSILAKPVDPLPALPLAYPNEDEWQVRVLSVKGHFCFSVWQHTGRNVLYPNEVVEKTLGVAATTRSWNTIEKVRELLGASSGT